MLNLRVLKKFSSSFEQIGIENTKKLIDSLGNYYSSLAYGPIKPLETVAKLPTELPMDPVPFDKVIERIQTFIYPKNLNWQHPMFYAWFPFSLSWEAVQAEILLSALGPENFRSLKDIGTQIEVCVLDWIAQMIGLPKQFHHSVGPGGGYTYATASQAVLTAMACAKLRKPVPKPLVYFSDQTHFSVEKAARVLGLEYRVIPAVYDPAVHNYPMSIHKLKEQIYLDKKNGHTPIFVCGTIGTTNLGATDDLVSLGEISNIEDMWFHIDAAYAGCLCILPELKYKLQGVELCTSFNANSHKMMLSGFGSSNMWVKDSKYFTNYLSDSSSDLNTSKDLDFKNWKFNTENEVKALKVWMVIQQRGVIGIKKHLQDHINATKYMESLVLQHGGFEVITRRDFGLLNFRVKGNNEKTERILQKLADNPRILLLGSNFNGQPFIRFATSSSFEDLSNINETFEIIKSYYDE